ncbi:hypothetical protein V8C86DRAFT_2658705 [Haematococcus lacustris]
MVSALLTAQKSLQTGVVAGSAPRIGTHCPPHAARLPGTSALSKRLLDFSPSCPLVHSRAMRVVARAQATVGAPAKPVPTPVVKIDNLTDPFATLVTVEYGDKLGELLETITALKNLNLNIRRAKLVSGKSGSTINAFYLTEADTSEKIVKSARLEEIRMTVLNLLVATYPESAQSLSGGKPSDSELTQPLGRRRSVVQTLIDVTEAPNGAASVLKITTSDRPGLLVDIVRVLKDINLNVVSAEVDTVGTQAQDEFFITYHGEPLTPPMVTLVTNALQYYLSLNEVAKEESY